jgi:hypothetical protein
METRARKKVHITWVEALRADAERDKARQARYQPRPVPSLAKIITAQLSTDLPKLGASLARLWNMRFSLSGQVSHRLHVAT